MRPTTKSSKSKTPICEQGRQPWVYARNRGRRCAHSFGTECANSLGTLHDRSDLKPQKLGRYKTCTALTPRHPRRTANQPASLAAGNSRSPAPVRTTTVDVRISRIANRCRNRRPVRMTTAKYVVKGSNGSETPMLAETPHLPILRTSIRSRISLRRFASRASAPAMTTTTTKNAIVSVKRSPPRNHMSPRLTQALTCSC